MSWLSQILRSLNIRKISTVFDLAIMSTQVAEKASRRFEEYAATEAYTSLFEHVEKLTHDDTMSGSEKRAIVLKAAASDVALWGEYFIKGCIEHILATLTTLRMEKT